MSSEWQTIRIPLRCFAAADLSTITTLIRIRSSSALTIGLSDLRLSEAQASDRCPA